MWLGQIFSVLFTLVAVRESASQEYVAYKHVTTGRYLDAEGKPICKLSQNSQLFENMTVGAEKNNRRVLFPYPGNGADDPKALTVKGGCNVNSEVSADAFNSKKKPRNQVWQFNDDGSIATLCNTQWRLILTKSGKQLVKNKNEVKYDDKKFYPVSHAAFDSDSPSSDEGDGCS